MASNSTPRRKNNHRPFIGFGSPKWKSSYSFETNTPSPNTSSIEDTEGDEWKHFRYNTMDNHNHQNYYQQNHHHNHSNSSDLSQAINRKDAGSEKTFLNCSFMSRIFRLSRRRSFKSKKSNKVKKLKLHDILNI